MTTDVSEDSNPFPAVWDMDCIADAVWEDARLTKSRKAMAYEMPREVNEELCRKLREVVAECGQASLNGAVMVGMYDAENVSDIPYITCPTVCKATLGNVEYQTARAFENA